MWRAREIGIMPEFSAAARKPWDRRDHADFVARLHDMIDAMLDEDPVPPLHRIRVETGQHQYLHAVRPRVNTILTCWDGCIAFPGGLHGLLG
jgi:hypothetical protein